MGKQRTGSQELIGARLLMPDDNPMGYAQSCLGQCVDAVRRGLGPETKVSVSPGIVRVDILGHGSVYVLDMEAADKLQVRMGEDE